MTAKDGKLVYPSGVRDITEDISTDDLVRRLKDCVHAFQNMSQDDDNSEYIPLALHFASETFLEHPSRDVRLLVACCIADVFRVYAPEPPYKDSEQLKVIFEFFVDQLRGLQDPSNASFKLYFYLLENFCCVKTFTLCVELEDNQKILCRLFKVMFTVINENHSSKVRKFILDMLSPLISEADVVSQDLLDLILSQIIEPLKSRNRNACSLAQDILKSNITPLEPYIQSFFNNALILGKTLESDVSCHLYELIYELNGICPSMLTAVLPQLEFKLKSNEEKERLDVTHVLGRMFSDKNSTMIEGNHTLWSCFLARFNDISPQVRIRCVQYCKSFLLNHPESSADITEQLKQRHRDVDENVRYEVVVAIVHTAKEDFSCINRDLLSFVKERTLDKKFKIRKEALLGLAMVYKQHIRSLSLTPAELESFSWIKNKVLHAYYQTSTEDRFLVERILNTCLVPYQKPMEERMKLLYQLFCSVDDYAVKAFKEIIKCQSLLRSQVKSILEVLQGEKSNNRQKTIANKVSILSKSLNDPTKSNEYILKFCADVESNLKLRNLMSELLNGQITCSQAEMKVKEILKSLGHPVQTNTYYMIIKQLLERIAPVMFDKESIRHLVKCVKDSLLGDGAIESELGLQNSARRGLELLWVLTFVFPLTFHDEEIYNNLLLFLQVEDDSLADRTLQIFMNVSNDMEKNFPAFKLKLLPILENFVETGTSKQAKHAVYCINAIVSDKEKVFGDIIENLKKHFTLESQSFRTALVSVGHIAYLCHDMFATDFKTIVAKIVVKDLLMLDQEIPRGGDETWGTLDSLPDETKAKIEGMKLMVRWLLGLQDMVQPAMSTLRLLTTVILHDGDLMQRQHSAPVENSWMRLSAANCMLKLCQEPNYASAILLEQFQALAYTLNDKCIEIRDRFAQKVHKGLFTLKLPLEFLAIFCLGALDNRKEFKCQVKKYITININKRKEYLKQRVLSTDQLRQMLPDYALPHAVHLLAHHPILKVYNDIPALQKLKDCLWLLMEPLMVKNENYSFSFFKRLLENIKQTRDKQAIDDDAANKKLYAVCDLALSIVMSKTTNFVLKDFPAEPVLPCKLFTPLDKSYSNLKTYLPPELIHAVKNLKSGFEVELFDGSTESQSGAHEESSASISYLVSPQTEDSMSNSTITSKTNESVENRTTRSNVRTRKNKQEIENMFSGNISEESSDKSISVNEQENIKTRKGQKRNTLRDNSEESSDKLDSANEHENIKIRKGQKRNTLRNNSEESSDKLDSSNEHENIKIRKGQKRNTLRNNSEESSDKLDSANEQEYIKTRKGQKRNTLRNNSEESSDKLDSANEHENIKTRKGQKRNTLRDNSEESSDKLDSANEQENIKIGKADEISVSEDISEESSDKLGSVNELEGIRTRRKSEKSVSEESGEKADSVNKQKNIKNATRRGRKKGISKDILENSSDIANFGNEPVNNDIGSHKRDMNEKDKPHSKHVQIRPLRSSRSTPTLSTKSTKSSKCESSEKQNGVTSNINSSFCNFDVESSLKECNVSLRKDEVERYIALNNSISDFLDENHLSDEDFQQQTAKRKRKREDSPIGRSVRSKTSLRITEKHKSSLRSSKPKAVHESISSPSFTKSSSRNLRGNKLSLLNGDHGNKDSQKRTIPQKVQNSKSQQKKNQRNQAKLNVRKR